MKGLCAILTLAAALVGCDEGVLDPADPGGNGGGPLLPSIDQIQVKGNHRSDWNPADELPLDRQDDAFIGVSRPSMRDQLHESNARVFHFGFHLTFQGGIDAGATGGYRFRTELESFCYYVRQCVDRIDAQRTALDWTGPTFILLEHFPNPDFDPALLEEYSQAQLEQYGWPMESYMYQIDLVTADVDRNRVLTPNDLRGQFASARDAVEADGWPTLDALDGKVIFVLIDRQGDLAEAYEQGRWRGGWGMEPDDPRFFVASDDPDDPLAVFFSFENMDDVPHVESLVRDGLMVHGAGDDMSTGLFEDAGAQLLTTIDLETVSFADPVRCNPATAQPDCDVHQAMLPPL